MSNAKDDGIYIASRVKHADKWKALRARGVPFISTWIDEAGEGETPDFGELWDRIHDEVLFSHCLILYVEPDDFPLKGALVEVGIALEADVRVVVVAPGVVLEGRTMRPLGSWLHHRLVRRCASLDEALGLLGVQPA